MLDLSHPRVDWSDGLRLGAGIDQVDRHTPTIVNAGYSRWSFWDGRCDTLWCQAVTPFEDQREMGSNRLRLAHTIDGDRDLRLAYIETFGPLPDMTDWLLTLDRFRMITSTRTTGGLDIDVSGSAG